MTVDPLVLRAGTDADHDSLAGVWRRAVEATHGFLTPADVDGIEVQVRREALPSLSITVATGRGVVLGWAGVRGNRVEALFVDPAALRQGVGAALLDAATGGLADVMLDVNEQNPSAAGFYRAQGFRPTGRSDHDGDGRPFPLIHMRRP